MLGAAVSKLPQHHIMPPGLKTQIAFAIIVTLCALLVLPTALSAHADRPAAKSSHVALPSAGSVATTVSAFSAASYTAASFSDWEK
jgi:hypothetical protein